MKRIVALVVSALLVAGVVVAFRTLPWWALVIGFLLVVLIGKFVVKRLLKKLILMPFKAKGAVLRGAAATVHSVAPSTALPIDHDRDEPTKPCAHYLMEVTIAPQNGSGPFQLWEPSALELARFDAVRRPESDEADDESGCNVEKIQVETEGQWNDDEGMKYGGAQRLQLWVAVQPGVRQLKFRYYLEEFGSVRIPECGDGLQPIARPQERLRLREETGLT